ncbi:MAG: hypothetical protein ACK41T_10215 [Pseudobdellovibrio sp.]
MCINKLTKIVFKACLIAQMLFVFTLVGCVSAQKSAVSDEIKYAETKALIEDKSKDDSNSASIDVFYHEDGSIRLEITALLGYRVGSLLMTKTQLNYILYPRKIFVEGPLTSKTLYPVFKQNVDPKLLWAIVFNKDIRNFGFNCKNTFEGYFCQGNGKVPDLNESTTILIEPVSGQNSEGHLDPLKKITINNPNLRFVWLFKAIKKHNKSYNETFVLKVPEDYRLITIK